MNLRNTWGAADEVSRIGTENVERIEIIQGAASAKYGADAIGGVVNIITKKSTDKPQLQFNLEGRQTARTIKGLQTAPYSNFFLRADSGKIGKVSLAIYGGKRDVMPVVAARDRRQVAKLFAKDTSEFPENSLRYYGDTSNAGIIGTYQLSDNQKLELRADHFNENLHRFVKRTNSDMEPMVQFKRNAKRDTYSLAYNMTGENTDVRVEGNFTRMRENDISLRTDFATNAYEGKNELNSIDDIDHRQASFKTTINHAVNDNHLLTIGFGYSKEDGRGSRLKSAPKTYEKTIDPWDYDKALYVEPKISSEATKVGDSEKKVSSRVHAYKFIYDKHGVPSWDLDYETSGYDAKNPNTQRPPVPFTEYINNADSFNSWAESGLTDDQKRRKAEFNAAIKAENESRLTAAGIRLPYDGTWMREYYQKNPIFNLTFNGKTFLQTYNELQNKVTFGEASIRKFYLTLQDTWNVNDDTIVTPIIRFDHSSLFGGNISASAGVTHHYKGNPNTRLKANIGTGYAEPGMGELYYNWEMYGGNPTGFGFARLGWYWIGNPNLKPEKSLNMDIAIEKDWKRTHLKASLFHNQIRNYLTVYFTGNILDFNPWLNSSSSAGFWKFLYAPDMIYSFKNIGRAQITGADLEIKQKIGKHFEARVGYTYLNARNQSDPNMPAKLLDKPTHKVDLGLNYTDEKRGWFASIWGNYYIDMLDSNALASKGSYMETDGWGAPHPTITYHFKTGEKQEYQKKTYGIWNLMVQKKFNKDSMAYFAVDNLFNHRDDDRALQEKVYRAGLNFKLTDAFDTAKAIDPVTGEVRIAQQTPFIVKPFDTQKPVGMHFTGDIRVRNNSFLGENKPSSRVTPDSIIEPGAARALRDAEGTSLESRIRIGTDIRWKPDMELSFLAEANSSQTNDTTDANADVTGPQNARIQRATITKNADKWDFSIGRIQESLGSTGYWFDSFFDGVRGVYTKENTHQLRIGVGSFKQATGIKDSAYTHATYQKFQRPPYLEEFLGIARSNFGYFSGGLLDDDKMPKDNENVAFVKQLMDVMKAYKDAHPEMTITGGLDTKPDIPADYPIEKLVTILERMQKMVLKAYEGNPRLFNSGPKEMRWGTNAYRGREISIPQKRLLIQLEGKDGIRYYGNDDEAKKALSPEEQAKVFGYWDINLSSWNDNDLAILNQMTAHKIHLSDPTIFADKKREDLLKTWWAKNGEDYIRQIELHVRYKTNDPTWKVITPSEEIRKQVVASLFLQPDNSPLMMVSGSDNYNMPQILTSYVEELTKALELVDNEALIPREALAATGYGVPMEGTVLVLDEIPSINKAFYISDSRQLNDRLGVTAWYLHSFGDKTYNIEHANGQQNDKYQFKDYARVLGVGARYQMTPHTTISFDMGMNFSKLGRHLNGQTIYDHPEGTHIFNLRGYKAGSTPKFWTLRFDIGATDTNIPGSWKAFLDYKYFEHGSFFGGNGTESLPDRYLDGIKSFTFGAGYVPAKNWLVEAFYTFGAEGIGKRDTLFGSENFRLGNYTRAQITYKF